MGSTRNSPCAGPRPATLFYNGPAAHFHFVATHMTRCCNTSAASAHQNAPTVKDQHQKLARTLYSLHLPAQRSSGQGFPLSPLRLSTWWWEYIPLHTMAEEKQPNSIGFAPKRLTPLGTHISSFHDTQQDLCLALLHASAGLGTVGVECRTLYGAVHREQHAYVMYYTTTKSTANRTASYQNNKPYQTTLCTTSTSSATRQADAGLHQGTAPYTTSCRSCSACRFARTSCWLAAVSFCRTSCSS